MVRSFTEQIEEESPFLCENNKFKFGHTKLEILWDTQRERTMRMLDIRIICYIRRKCDIS